MRVRSLVLVASAVALSLPSLNATAAPQQRGEQAVCAAADAGYAHCDAHVRTKGAAPDASTSYTSGYRPEQLVAAYGLTGVANTTTIAVVDAYAHPNAASDLSVYRTRFNLGPATFKQINQNGGTKLARGNVGWGQEEMLDLEMVSAICPTCPILYVGATSASFNDLAAAVKTAAAKGAKVISNSYGGSEFSSETSLASAYSIPGVAITVSSGDNGYGAEIPAAFKTVTAVGGTSLTLDSTTFARTSETAWSGAGSGCSAYISKPTWQKDTGCANRTVSDVSAVADPNTGVAVYDSYGSSGGKNWFVFGGTSVAAPIIAGVYGLSGNTAGVPAQLLYAPQAGLFDVTSGSNGSCTAAYLCTGGSGYDGPTGVGTPNGSLAGF